MTRIIIESQTSDKRVLDHIRNAGWDVEVVEEGTYKDDWQYRATAVLEDVLGTDVIFAIETRLFPLGGNVER